MTEYPGALSLAIQACVVFSSSHSIMTSHAYLRSTPLNPSTLRTPRTIISRRISLPRTLHPAAHFRNPTSNKPAGTAPRSPRIAAVYVAPRAPTAVHHEPSISYSCAAVLPSVSRIPVQQRTYFGNDAPSSNDTGPDFSIRTKARQRERTKMMLAEWKLFALPHIRQPSTGTFVNVRSSLWEDTRNHIYTASRLVLRPWREETLGWKLTRTVLGAVAAFVYMLFIGLGTYVAGCYLSAPPERRPEYCHRCGREMHFCERFWGADKSSRVEAELDRKRFCSACAGVLKEEGYIVGVFRVHGCVIPP